MQENNIRLIDEALANEPITNTFRLAWEFVTLNKKFTFTAMGIFVLLNLLGAIPLLSLIFGVLATLFGIVIQMHAGRTFYATKNIESYIEEVKSSDLERILKQYTKSAFGVYVGWIVLLFLIIMILAFVGVTTGVLNQNMTETEMVFALMGLGLPLFIVALILSYVQPLVYSNIILSNSFNEGFKSVFTLFSRDVWSSSMNKNYFAYVAKIGLVLIAIVFLLSALFGMVVMVPGLTLIFTVLLLMAMYVFMVLMSVMAMIARRIVED